MSRLIRSPRNPSTPDPSTTPPAVVPTDGPVSAAVTTPWPSSGASRRSFLVGAGAGAGASVLSAAALASGTAAAAATRAGGVDSADDGSVPDGAVVAYVRDAASGQITLMADGNEVVVVDHALARTLARKAR